MSRVIIAGAGTHRELPLYGLLDAGHEVAVVEHPRNIDASSAHYWLPMSLSEAISSGRLNELADGSWDCFTIWGEFALNHLMEVREILRIPGPQLNVEAVRNKLTMRTLANSAGISQPRYMMCNDVYDVIRFMESEDLDRAIIKPISSAGSIGVRLLSGTGNAAREIRSYGLGESFPLLCEEIVEGVEYSCEAFVAKGVASIYGVTEKFVTPPPYFYEVAHMFPAKLSADAVRRVEGFVQRLAHALGVESASMHVEFKLTEGEPTLIEAAGRLAGDNIPLLVDAVTGVNPYVVEIEHALGGNWSTAQTRRSSLRAFSFCIDAFPSRAATPELQQYISRLSPTRFTCQYWSPVKTEGYEPYRVSQLTGMTSISSEEMRRIVAEAAEGI